MKNFIRPSDCNSWDYVRAIRKAILNEEKTYSAMEPVWQSILSEQLFAFRDEEGKLHKSDNDFRSDEELGKTPLDAFMFFLERCQYPPPEILIALSDCFNLYLGAGGSLELEQVFFANKRVKKIGNASAQINRDKKYQWFELLSSFLEATDSAGKYKSTSKVEQVTRFLTEKGDYDTDPESFLRGYNRWKEQQNKDK
jgi:hypothetical protein